jgi:hypothetical protein
MNEVDETIARLETALGLTDGFFVGLAKEDDWSFVVKCHALMESACSYLLTAYFDSPAYADIFSRLEMSNKKTGKLAFLRAAGIIVPEEASFIVALSELRNSLVHNIHRVPFKFQDHVSSLDKNQEHSFAKSFGYAYLDSDDNDKLILKDSRPILSDPKSAILHGIKLILDIILLQVETHKFELEAVEQQKRIYEQVIANNRLHRIAETTGSRLATHCIS